ncbi:pyocin S6 family toxin immunity protein [Pseudomonas sp. Z1-29]|uniref:pyocin S6 family toxin immunity protein n=1 Tax=Pseudomonas sp. Z1-29 TaxID=2817410 RepID=UPI003DA8CF33
MVPYYSITGFYPDEKNDDSLQFEIDIKDIEQKEALAQMAEAKPFSKIGPGEQEITEEQLKRVEAILGRKLPVGLEYFIGATAD